MIYIFTLFLFIVLNLILPTMGIIPRTAEGLIGVPFSIFTHANFAHFWSNFVPLAILGGWIYIRSSSFFGIISCLTLGSGFLTWLIGGDRQLIFGASGLVTAMFGWIIMNGFKSGHILDALIGLVIMTLFGGSVFNSIVNAGYQVSWQAHLAGLIAGLTLPLILKPYASQTAVA